MISSIRTATRRASSIAARFTTRSLAFRCETTGDCARAGGRTCAEAVPVARAAPSTARASSLLPECLTCYPPQQDVVYDKGPVFPHRFLERLVNRFARGPRRDGWAGRSRQVKQLHRSIHAGTGQRLAIAGEVDAQTHDTLPD